MTLLNSGLKGLKSLPPLPALILVQRSVNQMIKYVAQFKLKLFCSMNIFLLKKPPTLLTVSFRILVQMGHGTTYHWGQLIMHNGHLDWSGLGGGLGLLEIKLFDILNF